jgi:hypothetical protein
VISPYGAPDFLTSSYLSFPIKKATVFVGIKYSSSSSLSMKGFACDTSSKSYLGVEASYALKYGLSGYEYLTFDVAGYSLVVETDITGAFGGSTPS